MSQGKRREGQTKLFANIVQ